MLTSSRVRLVQVQLPVSQRPAPAHLLVPPERQVPLSEQPEEERKEEDQRRLGPVKQPGGLPGPKGQPLEGLPGQDHTRQV